ncbi:hypothetical protein M1555_01535 [Patescibacteria group bacterium]|nr:hypothetical protein [Patescibacteria group bacterium]
MVAQFIPEYQLAYVQIPAVRNQDVMRLHWTGKGEYAAAIVDGWNDTAYLPGDQPGRQVAELVAATFPKLYRAATQESPQEKATYATGEMDRLVFEQFPNYATAVGVFFIHTAAQDLVVSVGDVSTYTWNGGQWLQPEEISDHRLDPAVYNSNVARFFGNSSLKQEGDPYSCTPDMLILSSATPVLFITDGMRDVLSLEEINRIASIAQQPRSQQQFLENLYLAIDEKKTQKDDISILLRGNLT